VWFFIDAALLRRTVFIALSSCSNVSAVAKREQIVQNAFSTTPATTSTFWLEIFIALQMPTATCLATQTEIYQSNCGLFSSWVGLHTIQCDLVEARTT
jgi:hypothetical protein